MNKSKSRILLSLGVITVVLMATVYGTRALFTDTETSENNVLAAGSIDLKIGNDSYYNSEVRGSTTWELTDLTIERFFDFDDLKPGDWGEDTIEIQVDTNPAWVCADITLTENAENGIIDPEADAGDVTNSELRGELINYLQFVFWADDGDNVWECSDEPVQDNPDIVYVDAVDAYCERPLLQGTPSQLEFPTTTFALADASGNAVWNEALQPGADNSKYIGKYWCFGTATPDPVAWDTAQDPTVHQGWACDAGAPGAMNDAQTDSLTADITFTAVQEKNNENYVCAPEERDLTSSTGDGWASVAGQFDEAWQADGRWGDGGTTPAENEVRIGLAGGGSPIAQAHSNNATGPWRDGVAESFTLVYDGSGNATLTIGDVTVDTTITPPTGSVPGANGYLGITVKTNVADSSVTVSNVQLDGVSPAVDTVTENVSGSREYLLIGGDTQLSDGFTLTGNLTFDWAGTTPSSAEDMSMLIQVEND